MVKLIGRLIGFIFVILILAGIFLGFVQWDQASAEGIAGLVKSIVDAIASITVFIIEIFVNVFQGV